MFSPLTVGAVSTVLAFLTNTITVKGLPHGGAATTTCRDGFSAGTDTVTFTVPYTSAQVVGIIGDFKNLTWSGNPPDTVTLNGPDDQVGTSRSYNTGGLDVTETLSEYYRPNLNCFGQGAPPQFSRYSLNTAFVEAHTFAQVNFDGDLVYMPYDGVSVTSTCLGRASILNYTANFCATDVATTASLLHSIHLADLQNVQAFLGNATFTSCGQFHVGGCP